MNIRLLRKMSQEELARQVNIPVEAVEHWEAGHRIPNKLEISVLTTLWQYTQTTTRDMCLLGLRLCELKNSGTWRDIISPKTNEVFGRSAFKIYCEETFGFSHTYTSNLLSLSKFVKANGDTVDFIDEIYEKYTKSQLIELASLNVKMHVYFNPSMTVKDIREAKTYIKHGTFLRDKNNSNFNFLRNMQKWKQALNIRE